MVMPRPINMLFPGLIYFAQVFWYFGDYCNKKKNWYFGDYLPARGVAKDGDIRGGGGGFHGVTLYDVTPLM